MKRTYGKLKTVLLALLCMALVFSLAFASIAVAEPQQTSGPITVTHDTDNKTLTVTLDALRLGDISKTTLSDAGDEIVEAVKAIIFDQFISDGSPVAAAIDEEGGVDSSMLGEYRDTLTDKLKEPGQLDKYLEGGYDILIKQAAAEYNKTHEMPPDDIVKFVQEVHDIVNEAINDQYSGDTNKIEELQERNRAKVNELAETIQDIVDGKEDSLTLADLLNAIEKLTVGDNTIRDDGRDQKPDR